TKVRQRLAPTVSAHFASNSLTIPALDQTPLLNTSNTRSSSVSGFQIGHSLHPPLCIGSPPSMAGKLALGLANRLGTAPSANIEPAPKTAFCLIKSLLLNDFLKVSICSRLSADSTSYKATSKIVTACYPFYNYKSSSCRIFPDLNKFLVASSASLSRRDSTLNNPL